jgi:hypothetical protein
MILRIVRILRATLGIPVPREVSEDCEDSEKPLPVQLGGQQCQRNPPQMVGLE